MILNNLHDWILLLIPTVAIFTTSSICKIGKDAGKGVKFRPPRYVFGPIWFCLTILMGLSWIYCTKSVQQKGPALFRATSSAELTSIYAIYVLLIVSLMLWIILYGCRSEPLKALWTFIPILIFCFMALASGSYISKIMISPLTAWVIFALLMATQEYQLGKN